MNTLTDSVAYENIPEEPAKSAPASNLKVLVAVGIGGAFEFYDFTLFALFASILAPAFFPMDDPAAALLLTIGTFGIGAVMRPVGAILLGGLGDRVGRKAILNLTFILMAIGSVAIGLIPRYETIGIWAPILVILARMLQGFSIGGEQGSGAAFVLEKIPYRRHGLYFGFLSSAGLGAIFFSSGIGLALNRLLGPESMAEWGWRIPFLLGGLIAPVGIYIRTQIPESEEFLKSKAELQKSSNPEAARPPLVLMTLLLIMGACIPGTVANYLAVVYMPTYLNSQVGVDLDLGFQATFICSAAIAFLMPICGGASDVVGRKPVILTGCLIILFASFPFYTILQNSPGFLTIVLVQLGFVIPMCMTTSTMAPFASEYFPTMRRSLGLSLALTMPIAVFGTCSPLIVTWLIMQTGSPLAPAYYMMGAGLAGFISVMLLPKRQRGESGLPA